MNSSQEGIDRVGPEPKRRYSSPLREEQRRATRARVIDAAGTVFAQRGYVATTMRAIADVAGVSVDTVYLNGSKRELLFAALEKLTVGDEGSHSALERPWIQELLAEPDLRRLLAALVSVIAGAHRRTVGIFTALVVGATADEELAEAYRGLVEGMRADSKVLASLFDERRGAHSGVPLEDLADTFWVLTHVDGYRHLVEEAGWSTERYAAWLEEMLTMVVLGTSGTGGPAPSRNAKKR